MRKDLNVKLVDSWEKKKELLDLLVYYAQSNSRLKSAKM